jgi:hypothetical protein
MNPVKILGIALLWSASTVAAGCSGEASSTAPNGQDGPVYQAREALTGLAITTWGGLENVNGTAFTNGSPNAVDLGVGTGWRCWLAGVGGRFADFGAAWIIKGEGINMQPASHFFLQVLPSPGDAGIVTAVCAPSTLVGSGPFVEEGQPNPGVQLTSANANNWCALNSFWLDGTGYYSAISTNNTNAANPQIIIGNPTWTLKGAAGSGLQIASCAQSALTGWWGYGIQAPATGTASFSLLQNDGKTPLPAGTACFLTNVQGSFTSNNLTDGVFLSFSSGGVWTLTATNAKSATVMCVH